MDPKDPPKFTSPNKPPKIPTMTQEERDEIFHQIEKMEKKMNGNSLDMDNEMNENLEHVEKKMEEWKHFMYDVLLHTLDDRLPKGDNKIQGNRENLE